MQFRYPQGMHCIQLVKLNPESVVDVLINSIMYSSSDFLFKLDIVLLHCLLHCSSNFFYLSSLVLVMTLSSQIYKALFKCYRFLFAVDSNRESPKVKAISVQTSEQCESHGHTLQTFCFGMFADSFSHFFSTQGQSGIPQPLLLHLTP
jgi:hypothetical protein